MFIAIGSTTSRQPLRSNAQLLTFSSLSLFPSSNPRLLPPNSASSAENTSTKLLAGSAEPQASELKLLVYDQQHFTIPDRVEDLNNFLCGLLKNPRTEELAYECYQKTKGRPGFRPGKPTLTSLVKYAVRTKKWDSVSLLVEDFRSFQVFPDRYTCSRLVRSCIAARKLRILGSLLDACESHGEVAVAAFGSAMTGYNKFHMYSSTIEVYTRMEAVGIGPDSGCLLRIMEAYLTTGGHEKVVGLFKEFEARKLNFAPFSAEIHRMLFDSLGKLGRPLEALQSFREMTEKGNSPDSSIYWTLISTFASIRDVKTTEELFREAESKRMLQNPELFLKIILMYLAKGMLDKTLEIVAAMKGTGIRVSDCILCTVVNGFSKKRGHVSAAKVFEDLVSQGYKPGQVTLASMINIYCQLKYYSLAEATFREMEEKGFDRCVVAYSSMVVMYGKTGRLGNAMRLLGKMKQKGCEPNVWIYNSLLEMHGKAKNFRIMEKLWIEMKRRKVAADKVSYTTVINTYSKAGELEKCTRLYEEYMANNGKIDKAMAGIMVGVFSRTDQVEKLVKLLQDMKAGGTRLDERLYWSAFCALKDAGLPMQMRSQHENFGDASQFLELRTERGSP